MLCEREIGEVERMEEQKVTDLGHGGDAENEKALEEVVQALPSDAVSHLSSLGVS